MDVHLVQLIPIFKKVEVNLEKATRIIKGLSLGVGVGASSLVIFPEMAFTGYCFEDKGDIMDYCIDIQDEKSLILKWAKKTAKEFKIYIQFGVARKDANLLYNSLLLLDPEGTVINCYDKSHLYYTDETWASEGSGFKSMNLRLNDADLTVGFAICMDFNNYKFQAPWDAYEMATFYAEKKARLLLCCMAWLESPDEHKKTEKEMIMDRLNYWASRLVPIIQRTKDDPEGYRCSILICNRAGREGELIFGGTTCALEIENGKVSLLGVLGTNEESVLRVTLNFQ